MNEIFRLLKTAPLAARVPSRECCTNMFRVFKIVGWIPPEQGWRRYVCLFWAYSIFAFSMVYLPIGFVLSVAKDIHSFTPGEFLSVLQISFNAFGITAMTIIVFMLFSRFDQTRTLLDELDMYLQDDKDYQKIHKAVGFCNKLFSSFAKLYLFYTLLEIVSAALNSQPPWLVYNPVFNWRDGVIKLWLQITFESIVMSLAVFVDLVFDTYTITFVIIFRAHVDILKDHILNLRTDSLKSETENYEELVSCITYHKLILQCCNLMRPVMSGTIFVQFLIIGMLLGVTMINLMNFADKYTIFSCIVYLFGIFLQTFPFCYLCDFLANDSKDLSNLLSHSQWIDAEPKYKKTLMIFMHHVQKPVIFMAGGIFTISLTSNIQMAKIAFSVMTLVQEMNLADRFT